MRKTLFIKALFMMMLIIFIPIVHADFVSRCWDKKKEVDTASDNLDSMVAALGAIASALYFMYILFSAIHSVLMTVSSLLNLGFFSWGKKSPIPPVTAAANTGEPIFNGAMAAWNSFYYYVEIIGCYLTEGWCGFCWEKHKEDQSEKDPKDMETEDEVKAAKDQLVAEKSEAEQIFDTKSKQLAKEGIVVINEDDTTWTAGDKLFDAENSLKDSIEDEYSEYTGGKDITFADSKKMKEDLAPALRAGTIPKERERVMMAAIIKQEKIENSWEVLDEAGDAEDTLIVLEEREKELDSRLSELQKPANEPDPEAEKDKSDILAKTATSTDQKKGWDLGEYVDTFKKKFKSFEEEYLNEGSVLDKIGGTANPMSNIYTSVFCLSLIGIIINLKRYIFIQNAYTCCLESACEADTEQGVAAMRVCEKTYQENTCMYFTGGGIMAVANLIIGMVKKYMTDLIKKGLGKVGESYLNEILAGAFALQQLAGLPSQVQQVTDAYNMMMEVFEDDDCSTINTINLPRNQNRHYSIDEDLRSQAYLRRDVDGEQQWYKSETDPYTGDREFKALESGEASEDGTVDPWASTTGETVADEVIGSIVAQTLNVGVDAIIQQQCAVLHDAS